MLGKYLGILLALVIFTVHIPVNISSIYDRLAWQVTECINLTFALCSTRTLNAYKVVMRERVVMSKINQIQNALKGLDGGAFQKLADSYIFKKGYQNINPIGSALGSDKVRKGTPDSYFRQKNGKLVFAEYTTDQTNIVKKLKGDLEKCLDTTKTGIPLDEIEEIVFCHNSQLPLLDEQALYKTCKDNGIKIQVFGLESISFDLYQKHPSLAQDFLGISIDTGQILEPMEFVENVGKNKTSTPLDTDFHYREEELTEIQEKIEINELVILTGSAGVGKSRLALQALEAFKKTHDNYKLLVIYNKGPDLFEDIRSYFSEPGNFLLLVDDANRITQFDYIVDLIQKQRKDQKIKVIATVRDYARDKINNTAKALGNVSEVEIKPMNPEEIKGFIEAQYNINNSLYLNRISDIAGGNPRLAIMAAILAVKENSLKSIRDVSALYDEYFSSISSDLKELQDTHTLKVAGIISFFRAIDKSNTEAMELIQNVFGISSKDFWKSVEYLHEAEIVDVYEKEVVKISDQVFSTYLFYLCFFKERTLSFSLLLENFFPSQINKLKDAIYPCLNSFDFDQISEAIRNDVKKRWANCIEENNENDLHELIKAFWFLLQSDVLIYVRDNIAKIESQPIDLPSITFESANVTLNAYPLLEILARFNQESDESTFKTALDIVFLHIEKVPSAAPQFIKLMTNDFGFNRHSYQSEYLFQTILINALWGKTENGKNKLFSRLFIEVTSKYLKTRYDNHEGSNRTITIYKFELLPIEPVFNLRKVMWEGIFELYKTSNLRAYVSSAIRSYCGSGYYLSQKEIVKRDAESIIPFMETEFDPKDFSECLLVQKYHKLLKRKEILLTEKLSQKFLSDTYELYNMMSFNYSDVESDNTSDFDKIRKKRIKTYSISFGFEEYQTFIIKSNEILSLLEGSPDTHQIRSAVTQTFLFLSERDAALYEMVISEYIRTGNTLKLNQEQTLIDKLIGACGDQKALNILREAEYSFKNQWLFDYYRCLSLENVTQEAAKELLALYDEATPREIPHGYDHLLNYVEADKNIIAKVIGLIITKTEKDQNFGCCLDMLFNHLTEINKRLFDLLEGDLTLIKKAYLTHCKSSQNADYNGATLSRILSADPAFLSEIIELQDYNSEWANGRDYSFLWKHENCEAIVEIAIKKILRINLSKGCFLGSYLEKLFCARSNTECLPEIKEKQDNFLKNIIEEKSSDTDLMKLIFNLISEFKPDRRVQFIQLFIDNNNNYSEFEALSFEPSHWTYGGSAVPHYQARVEYWSTLLPLFNTTDLLEHKLFIENTIQRLRARVEQEKKSDFMEDME